MSIVAPERCRHRPLDRKAIMAATSDVGTRSPRGKIDFTASSPPRAVAAMSDIDVRTMPGAMT